MLGNMIRLDRMIRLSIMAWLRIMVRLRIMAKAPIDAALLHSGLSCTSFGQDYAQVGSRMALPLPFVRTGTSIVVTVRGRVGVG